MAESNTNQAVGTARTVQRAFDMLRVLRESRIPLRLSDIAQETGNHLATTQRILNILVASGYALQDRGGYSIGITSLLNSYSFLVSNSLIQIAQPVVQELAVTSGHFTSMAVRVEFTQILVLKVEGVRPLRYQRPVGEPMPIYLGGGRILAAALEKDELDDLLSTIPEVRLASGEIVTHDEFVESLRIIREQGYVWGYSQREEGAASAAVPVFDYEGRVVASLQISGYAEDFDQSKMEWCVTELKRASTAIGKRLP
jgi:IclR family acetate operon transcriptional repressor